MTKNKWMATTALAAVALIDEASTAVAGTAAKGNEFGSYLAAGDINGDGRADLVAFAYRTVGKLVGAGSITYLPGSSSGLTGHGSREFTQNTPGIPGTAATLNMFGQNLSIGDFNGDGYADIAVGVPFNDGAGCGDGDSDKPGDMDADGMTYGSVTIIGGSAHGPTSSGAKAWTAAKEGISKEFGYGEKILALNVESSTKSDLMIVTDYTPKGTKNTHAVIGVLRGSSKGLTTTGGQVIHHPKAASASNWVSAI